jgi:exonuclease III
MPPHPKPRFSYTIRPSVEVQALRRYRDQAPGRQIPAKGAGHLMLATWNIANLGVQERSEEAYHLIAEILSWFDLIAVQETNDDLSGLRGIQAKLPTQYAAVFSGASGNNERLTFLYDATKVERAEKVGSLSVPPSDLANIKVPGSNEQFRGFDRSPYTAAFRAGQTTFLLVNVHSYFGGAGGQSIIRRQLETFAVARWCEQRHKARTAYTPNIIALGDFNLPQATAGDRIYDTLVSKGLLLPKHSTQAGSSLDGLDHYDQIAYFAGPLAASAAGVFDFDGAVFRDLWQGRSQDDFFRFIRYYLSDHRPLWAKFAV